MAEVKFDAPRPSRSATEGDWFPWVTVDGDSVTQNGAPVEFRIRKLSRRVARNAWKKREHRKLDKRRHVFVKEPPTAEEEDEIVDELLEYMWRDVRNLSIVVPDDETRRFLAAELGEIPKGDRVQLDGRLTAAIKFMLVDNYPTIQEFINETNERLEETEEGREKELDRNLGNGSSSG